MIPEWVRDYMDIPFEDHGRAKQGCDCYGLVRLIFWDQFGIDLPLLTAGYKNTITDRKQIGKLVNMYKALLDVDEVTTPQLGDIAIIIRMGEPCHVGLMVTKLLLLHTEAPGGPRLANIKHVYLRGQIEGFYRYRGLAGNCVPPSV